MNVVVASVLAVVCTLDPLQPAAEPAPSFSLRRKLLIPHHPNATCIGLDREPACRSDPNSILEM